MAEALLRDLDGDAFAAFSAGTEATSIRPETIAVMEEIGIGLEGQWSKAIDEYRGQAFDWFITVCDDAHEACPVCPGAPNAAHWSIDDPSSVTGGEAERLDAFRRARDEVRERIEAFVRDA